MLYQVLVAILRPIFFFLFRMKFVNKENIPKGAAVVCVNHTTMFDAVFIALAFGRKDPFAFMGKKELFDNAVLRWFFNKIGAFPVDRGTADLATIRNSISALKSGKKLLIFPEGTRVKDGNNSSEDIKSGVAMIALKAKAPMLPVYLSTKKRLFKKTYIVVGKPIIPEKKEGTSSENYKRIATEAFDTIIELGAEYK